MTPGYKQTEVGIIPADWSLRPLFEAVQIANGQVDPRLQPYKSMVLVAPDHVESDTGRLIAKRTAEEQGAISGKYLFAPGDVVYSKIRPYLHKAILTDFAGLCSADMYPLTPRKDVACGYVLAVLLGRRFSEFAESVSVRSGIPKINREEMAEFAIPLPPPQEQRAIAVALSHVDALLLKLDQLIAKKRDVKQGVLQELLTGNRRLPGFTGTWQQFQLGDTGAFSKGMGIRKDDVLAEGIPCVRYGELYTHHNDYIRRFNSFISRKVASNSRKLRTGELLFAGSGETAEEIGKCAAYLGTEETYAGSDIVIFTPRNQDSMYLGYLMNHPTVVAQKARMGQGDAVVHISAKNLAALELMLPAPDEQAAIATVIADVDSEISALEARRDKTRAIKQGMMQELLSGRIRLV